MPAGFDYNTLFQLKAFQNAESIDYNFGKEIDEPINLHLDTDVLIDFLHLPGQRWLDLTDFWC
jgi:hypothetical protein